MLGRSDASRGYLDEALKKPLNRRGFELIQIRRDTLLARMVADVARELGCDLRIATRQLTRPQENGNIILKATRA